MKRSLLLLSGLAIAGCEAPADPAFVDWLPSHGTVVAHRGGADLAPENTLAAFHKAVEPGIDSEIIELDLHTSADDVVVVNHDKSVDRTTGVGQGCDIEQDTVSETFGDVKVHDLTVAELQELDAGRCHVDLDGIRSFEGQGVVIPTLREVLDELPTQRFMLEIKQTEPSVVPGVLELLTELDAFDRTCFLAFDEGVTQELAETAPEGTCISMPASGIRCWSTEAIFPFGGGGCPAYDVMWMPHTNSGFNLKRESLVDDLHAAGMPVFMWTINDPAVMAEAYDAGVDGVVTDRPDLARELVGSRGVGPNTN